MTQSRLIELSYYDPSAQVRLSAYADTVVLDHNSKGGIISAVRFGGYSEMVRAMSDAIYGGATIEATQNSTTRMLQSNVKGYQRQMSHDGVYAVATLMASDDAQTDDRASEGDGEVEGQEAMQPRKCYIFCPQGDRDRLFEELDHKTAAPLIPAFRDYVLDALQKRGDLRQLEVISLKEKMDAWVLDLKPEDRNVVEVLETGLKNGSIQIPGAIPGAPDGFDGVENVTGYLNTFGVTVADRIRHQFMPLFDPANEPLSDEVLAINDCIMNRAGYSLYDAQLAVAEAVKRQLDRKSVALIIAECGAGKTKIGSTALGALHGLWAAQKRSGAGKSFGIIMCPSHVTRKWVREIGETLPDTYAMVVHSIAELDRLYAMYEQGDKSVYAVFSKERARDGYMRYRCNLCGAHGNSVSLYARIKGISNAEAYRELVKESKVYPMPQQPTPQNSERQPVSLEQRHAAYSDMLDHLVLLDKHGENLLERGLSEERIRENGYRSMPETERGRRLLADLLRSHGHELCGLPGFRTYYGDWTISGPNGFLIPVRNKDGLIQGLKIRLDDADTPDRKYRWFSSRNMPNGTRSYSWVHVTGDTSRKRAFLTEGPLKGDVASHLANNELFICIGGVNALGGLTDTIRELGVREIVEAMDMDQMTNKNVRDAILTMRKEVKKIPGIRYSKYTWNPAYKGVDDYLLSRVAAM